MRKRWKPRVNRSLDDNARPLLGFLYGQFISHAESVIRHPRLRDKLHEMRIDGKPLRYMMEIFHPIYGRAFRKCFDDVKHLLELLGKIHDCDVTIPILQKHLREIRLFNPALIKREERVSTKGIRELIRIQREQRKNLYEDMGRVIRTWRKENFREKLLRAMKLP